MKMCMFVDVRHNIIGVYKEGKTYSVLSTKELDECKTINGHFFFDRNTAVYYVDNKSSCEVRYLRESAICGT